MCKPSYCRSPDNYKETGYCKACYKIKKDAQKNCTTIGCTNMTPNGMCGTCRKTSVDPDIIVGLVAKHVTPKSKK
jgi:hypothetical protein